MKPVLALSSLILGAALFPAASFAQSPTDPSTDQSQDSTQSTATSQAQGPDTSTQSTVTQDQSGTTATTTVRQDTPIASKIEAEMAAQHIPSMNSIMVNADASGVVSLSGNALSQSDVDRVVAIAQNTAGVTAVNNNVTLRAN